MLPACLAFAVGAVLALLLTPVAGRLARRIGAIDVANSLRKLHRRPVPRIGGLAIVIGAFAATAVATLGIPAMGDHRPLGLAFGAVLVAGLGLRDDVRGTGAFTKLFVQACAAVVAWSVGFGLGSIWTPFGALALGPFDLPLTVLWIVGVTNAVNLVDGLDGLAAGLASIAGAALSALALWRGDLFVGLAGAAVSGASLGFLKWNRHPASIFMGDTGSLFLGYILAVLSLPAASTGGAPLLPAALVLGIPVVDTLLAIVRRTARGVPVHLGDRGHLHHRLLAIGFSPQDAVSALHLAGLACALAGLALAATSGLFGIVVLVAFASAAVMGLRTLGMRPLFAFRAIVAERARNLTLRRMVRRAGRDIAVASDRQAVLCAVTSAALSLGAVRAEVEPGGESGGSPAHGAVTKAQSRHALAAGRQPKLALVLEWGQIDGGLDRDREIAVEQLCAHATRALRRMARRDAMQGTWAVLRTLRRSEASSLARVD